MRLANVYLAECGDQLKGGRRTWLLLATGLTRTVSGSTANHLPDST